MKFTAAIGILVATYSVAPFSITVAFISKPRLIWFGSGSYENDSFFVAGRGAYCQNNHNNHIDALEGANHRNEVADEATNDSAMRYETSSESRSENALEDTNSSATIDDRMEDVAIEAGNIDPLEQDRLSRMNLPYHTSDQSVREINILEDEKARQDNECGVLTADSIDAEEGGDREEIYVDDTYLLGQQIVLALESTEIDVVGIDSDKDIAAVLADSLLESIQQDSDDRENNGWNQYGAETLYSIGTAERTGGNHRFEEGFSSDEDFFTDDLVQQISIETTAATTSEEDSDLCHCNEEEIESVADSIIDIINRGRDDTDDEETATEISQTGTQYDRDGHENGDRPAPRRYVLKPDGDFV